MHHFDFYKHRGHYHDRHHHKRDRKHGGKFCKKFGKRGHHFKDIFSDLATKNPQDPDIEETMRLFVKEFFNQRFMERQAGMENSKEKEAGEGTSKQGDNPQASVNTGCMWKGRGRRHGWKGCQTAGRNISESAMETEGKQSEEDTEETPYCKHLNHHHHHQGYERRHHGYGHGKCQQGRSSGDEFDNNDERWIRRGRRHHHDHHRHHDDHHHHHDHHHDHHRGRHGYNHHWRMGWKDHGCDCFHQVKATTIADSGSQEPNQEVGGNDMQIDPAPAPGIENLENEGESQQEVQEVAETLRKSSLE